jgi:fluoroquinolone resistance protein
MKNMEQIFIEGKVFDRVISPDTPLAKGEYDHCIFRNNDFSNAELSGFIFTDCEFNTCNLSLVRLAKTVFREVKFKDCKMIGLRFDDCNQFSLSFNLDNCNLNHSSFFQVKSIKTKFMNSQFQEADFTGVDFTGSVFDNCDFAKATFQNTILEKVDFRSSYNYSINPEENRIRKARFSQAGISGLLNQYDIEIE